MSDYYRIKVWGRNDYLLDPYGEGELRELTDCDINGVVVFIKDYVAEKLGLDDEQLVRFTPFDAKKLMAYLCPPLESLRDYYDDYCPLYA